MFGANMGSLHIDLFSNGIWNNDIGPALTGDQGNNWNSMSVDLTAYAGNSIKLRIRAITGNGFGSDIAIDDIRFEQTLLSTNLVNIDVNCNQNSYNQMDWELSDADYSGVFYIEKLGSEWTTIGELETTGTNRYRFNDNYPLLGQNLYRLKWADSGGAIHYSSVVSTDCVFNTSTVEIFPNPFQESVSIQFYIEKTASMPYKITTLLGKFLESGFLEGTIGLNTYTLTFDDLAQGVYLMHINGKLFKLIKQ
jgi:bacillopeptidase F (M6 metalloprotease family)